MSEFKSIRYENLVLDKKYLIHYENDDFHLFTCYYDGLIQIKGVDHVIFKNVKDLYNNVYPFKVYHNSIKIYYFNGKRDIAQTNMENRALNKIFKKIIGDENFDIGLRLSNRPTIQIDVLEES